MAVIPKYSLNEGYRVLKEWNWLIDNDVKFLIALKNNFLELEKISIDVHRLNQLNLLILENITDN